jgi:hypothetical protein
MQACVQYRPPSLPLYLTTYFPPSLSPSLCQTHELNRGGGVDALERKRDSEREIERERERALGSERCLYWGGREKVMRHRHPVYSLACTAYNLLLAAFPV